jgi:large subunit ribosomal protein L25
MTETFSLKAELREKLGTSNSAVARKQGKLPVNVYGHKQASISVAIDNHAFVEAIRKGHRLFDMDIAGKNEKLLLKDVQYDYLGKNIIHADLMRVDLSETVKVFVPIVLKGTAPGTLSGGIIDEVLSKLEVECVVTNIPEAIPVSVKSLEIGKSIHAGEIELPEGVKLLTDPLAMVLSCHILIVKAVAEGTEEGAVAAPASPEVLTEKNKEAKEK